MVNLIIFLHQLHPQFQLQPQPQLQFQFQFQFQFQLHPHPHPQLQLQLQLPAPAPAPAPAPVPSVVSVPINSTVSAIHDVSKYKDKADKIRGYINTVSYTLSGNAELKRFVENVALKKPHIEYVIQFFDADTTNDTRLEMMTNILANENNITELLNNQDILDAIKQINYEYKSAYKPIANAGISAFLNDSDIKPLQPVLLRILFIVSEIIFLITDKKTANPYVRGVANYMADIPYTVAKKTAVLVPPLNVPYGIFKSVVATPAFDSSIKAFDSLLTSIGRSLTSNKDNEFIQKMKVVYNGNTNRPEYDKFVDILTETVLSHAPKTMDGGKRRYTRKNRRNKRKTRRVKRRTKRGTIRR